jgi:GT2 family glycosyltransferase
MSHTMQRQRKPVRVSVIIPAYNASATLCQCLEAVYRSGYSDFEVIVVDDASEDNTLTIAQDFPCQVIALPHRSHVAAVRNAGAAYANGQILLFVDADVLIKEDTIERVVQTFERRPEASALIGSYDRESLHRNFVSQYKNLYQHYTHQQNGGYVSEYWGALGAIRKDIFEAVGGFDESYHYMEDVAFGLKLARQGYRVYLDKGLMVFHCKKYTLCSLIKTDLETRAIPWTKIILQERQCNDELSTTWRDRAALVSIYGLLFSTLTTPVALLPWTCHAIVVILAAAGFAVCNHQLYAFLLRERGWRFLLGGIFLNCLYYLYCGVGFAVGLFAHLNDHLHTLLGGAVALQRGKRWSKSMR